MALEKCSLENEGKVMNIGFPLSYVLIFINLLPLFTKEVFLYYKMSKILWTEKQWLVHQLQQVPQIF